MEGMHISVVLTRKAIKNSTVSQKDVFLPYFCFNSIPNRINIPNSSSTARQLIALLLAN
jgi:hypothetical protein